MDTKNLLAIAEEAARIAGAALRAHKPKVIKSWGKDMKIDADKDIHRLILKHLSTTGIPVLSEEDDMHNFDMDLKWVVDPLDGSINFVRGIPACVVSIALMKNGEPIIGVVYDFNRNEIFSGIVGTGAWLNGKRFFVSTVRERGEAILMTGFPSHTDYATEALEKYISTVQSFKKVRLLGSAALSLAYVASGRADAYYEKDIKIWDVAAGLALVKAAGGEYRNPKIDIEGKCTTFVSNGNLLIEDLNTQHSK
ncbi:inositol monophosphatase [Candidatus Kaiserbacteria bacterium]|nr:inositol monophosphatase [Candidatus Kaiserbacteria bacterium]